MLDELGMGGFVKSLPSMMNNIMFTLVIIFGMCIFAGMILWIIYQKSFNRKVRIRKIVNGRSIIKDDMAKPVKDEKGVLWWKLKNEKDKKRRLMPAPPSDAIDINTDGKEVVEVYYNDTGDYIFCKDKARVAELPKDLFKNIPDEYQHIEDTEAREVAIHKWKDTVLGDWKKDNGVVEAFQPFTTQQRVLTVNAVMDAEERRGKNIWKDLPQLAALSALVIIVVSLMIFWGDLAKPVLDAKQMDTLQLQMMQEISTTQSEIRNEIQTLKSNQPTNAPAAPN